jgi:thiosulfate/3-mercaptopyruvate sulfurtransferase
MAQWHRRPSPEGAFEGPLVDGAWLERHLDDVAVADVRWYLDGRSGHDAYLAGHIPGAVWLDIDTDLADPPGPGRHPLPAPERFAEALSRSGIGDDTPVVVYDDAGGSIAARLWWLLSLLDHPVAVLDGGLAAWPSALETGEAEPAPAMFTPRPFPPWKLAEADEVAKAANRDDTVVLDARPTARYAHGDPKVDPRPGHVPGARNVPWAGNLGSDGRLRSAGELRNRYQAVGVTPERQVVAYCGSGVTACHDLLALTVAGLGSLRLYPGSWSEWGADLSRPTAEGVDEPKEA